MAVMIGGALTCPFVGRIPARMNEAAFRKGCLACQQKAKLRKQALWGFVDTSTFLVHQSIQQKHYDYHFYNHKKYYQQHYLHYTYSKLHTLDLLYTK